MRELLNMSSEWRRYHVRSRRTHRPLPYWMRNARRFLAHASHGASLPPSRSLGPRLPATTTHPLSGFALAIVCWRTVLVLARGNPRHRDGVADHVGHSDRQEGGPHRPPFCF